MAAEVEAAKRRVEEIRRKRAARTERQQRMVKKKSSSKDVGRMKAASEGHAHKHSRREGTRSKEKVESRDDSAWETQAATKTNASKPPEQPAVTAATRPIGWETNAVEESAAAKQHKGASNAQAADDDDDSWGRPAKKQNDATWLTAHTRRRSSFLFLVDRVYVCACVYVFVGCGVLVCV